MWSGLNSYLFWKLTQIDSRTKEQSFVKIVGIINFKSSSVYCCIKDDKTLLKYQLFFSFKLKELDIFPANS